MLEPALADDDLLRDVHSARRETEALHLWWLGQSGFLVAWEGRCLLLDPYLSDSLTRKYANTDKPHIRMTRRCIDPRRLRGIDMVASTHAHTDHLDGETLVALLEANPQLTIVVPEAHQQLAAERLGVDPQRLMPIDAEMTVEQSGFTLHAIPAAHETVERDEQGCCRFLGYLCHCGPWTVYHSGDTVRYNGLAERLRTAKVDVALLPINGRASQRRVAGNLWGREAAQLAFDAGARLVIPCHFQMFAFNSVTPDEFVTTAQQLGQPYCVLRTGERWSSYWL